MTKKRFVTVIGGGAAGLAAAVRAAERGAKVTILEHNDRVGKKILSTGNGKCNFANRLQKPEFWRSGDPDFPWAVISRFPIGEVEHFFESLGIVISERDGYLYPASGQAASILDVLRHRADHLGVRTVVNCHIEEIRDQKKLTADPGKTAADRFQIRTDCGNFAADAVILAAGSKAAPKSGSDGSGYAIAEIYGHRIIEPLPALVQLRCAEKFYGKVSGVRVRARVALRDVASGSLLAEDTGEVQLTDYGISGIPVFQVSRYASRAIADGKKIRAELNFWPDLSENELLDMLVQRRAMLGEKDPSEFLTGWFNRKLGNLLMERAGIRFDGAGAVSALTDKDLAKLSRMIHAFPTEITGTNSFEQAQVCCGGIDVCEISPETMESRKRPGLYFAGEIVDVDGICGGYNLHWAWASGFVAGSAAASVQ